VFVVVVAAAAAECCRRGRNDGLGQKCI